MTRATPSHGSNSSEEYFMLRAKAIFKLQRQRELELVAPTIDSSGPFHHKSIQAESNGNTMVNEASKFKHKNELGWKTQERKAIIIS